MDYHALRWTNVAFGPHRQQYLHSLAVPRLGAVKPQQLRQLIQYPATLGSGVRLPSIGLNFPEIPRVSTASCIMVCLQTRLESYLWREIWVWPDAEDGRPSNPVISKRYFREIGIPV